MGSIKQLLALILALFCLIVVETTHAANSLPPRFSTNAYASDYTVGQADLMLPLNSNNAHNFYIDPNVAYASDNQGYADLGLGYRWVKNEAAILGVYLFGGYTRIENNVRLWVANPGVEALGSRWDAHLNGYLVMLGDRNTIVSKFTTFDEFSVHSALFNVFDVTQHAGDGADVKLGYQLFPGTPLKAYVGSYFFSPAQTSNILGGAAGLEYWFDSHVKVFAGYTYDNYQHSTGALGLGIEFGGTNTHRGDPSVEERLTDPVERYLANLGHGSAIPSAKRTQIESQPIAMMNNLVFFNEAGMPNNGGMGLTADNCTFENPCGPTDLTDVGTATLSGLFPNTAIFFEGGSFDALDVVNGTNPVTIRAGQSLNAAPGSPPSTLNGGLILEGNNALNDIILVPTVATATGEGVSASAGSVVINNSQIGSMANPFTTGLAFSGNTQANLNNSTVFASANGVILADSATLTVDPSVINVNGGDNLVGIDSSSSGALNITNGSSVNVTGGNGVIGVNFTGDGNFDLSDASFINVTGTNGSFGLSTAGVGTVTVSGASSITLTTTGGANSFGYRYAGSGAVNFSAESSLNVNGTGPNLVQGFADLPFASGNVTFDASSINVTNNGAAVGILSQGTGNLNIINESTLNVTGGDQSIGINVIGDQVINMTDSQVVVTGGIFSFGLFSSGTGNISLNGSTLNFTGEDFSTGLSSEGDGNISLNGSAFNVTGGLFSTGLLSEGDGNISINGSTFNFFGLDDCIGFDKNQGDGAVNVSDGSVINVTAGENAITAQFGGNGAVNFSEGSSVILNAAGHSNAIGIFILPGATSTLTLDGTQIIVFGGSNAQGINVSANTSVNLVNQSFVDVNGTGPGSTIGINNANGTVTGDSINVIVTSDDGQALGLATQNAATITLDSSSFDVSGGDLSSAISQASGGLITLTNSTCVLNGVLVTC